MLLLIYRVSAAETERTTLGHKIPRLWSIPTRVLFLSDFVWVYFFKRLQLSRLQLLSCFFYFATEKYRCSMKLILKFCAGNPERVPVLFEEDYPCPYSSLQGQQQKLKPSDSLHCSAKSNRQVPCWHNSIKTTGFSPLEIIALKFFQQFPRRKSTAWPWKEIKGSVIDCQYLKFKDCKLREEQHLERIPQILWIKIMPKQNKHMFLCLAPSNGNVTYNVCVNTYLLYF